MKTPLVLSLLAIVIATATFVSSLVGGGSEGRRDAVELPAASGPDLGAALDLRVEELAEENRALRERLALLELRPEPAPAMRTPVTDGLVPRDEFEAFRDEVREALALKSPSGLKGPVGAAGLKEEVVQALGEVRKAEAAEKVAKWREGRVDRLDETMPKLEASLGLTSAQSAQMRSALLAQYDREAELTRRWQAGEDPEALGEIKGTDRETHLAELSGILTPEQLESYTTRRNRGGK